jgi:hypothetical protein
MTKDKALTGAAGAYYVAYRLSALGYAVGLTTYGTRAIDLIVAKPDTGKSITIQTKTMQKSFVQSRKWGPYWKWPVGKSQRLPQESYFYAFVDLKNDPVQTPDVFIVPSAELPPLLEEYPNMTFCVIYEKDRQKYYDRWDIFKSALE